MASVKKSTKASATDLAHARKQAQMKLKFCVPHLNYRSMTRAIAFLQLTASAIALAFFLLFMYFIGVFTMLFQSDSIEVEKQFGKMVNGFAEVPVFLGASWFFIILMLIDVALQLWSSLSLVKATEVGTSASKCLQCTRFWRNTTLILTVPEITMCAAVKADGLALSILVIRLMYFWIVARFAATREGNKVLLIKTSNGKISTMYAVPVSEIV